MTKNYKHAVVLDNYSLMWLYHDFWLGLPSITSDASLASVFETSEKLSDKELSDYVDVNRVRKYHIIEIKGVRKSSKTKDKYQEQLDRIEQKVDALLNAEINKMPKVAPPPFVPTCSRCGLGFEYIDCRDPQCPSFDTIHLDPDKRDWEYDGYGVKRPKGEID